jgi:hypothetical protein
MAPAICFRLFDPNHQIGLCRAVRLGAVASGIIFAMLGALYLLVALYGAALAAVDHIAPPR